MVFAPEENDLSSIGVASTVLICTQNLLRGGLETRLSDEVSWLAKHRFRVHIACGGAADVKTIALLAQHELHEGFAFKTAATAEELVADVERLRLLIRSRGVSHLYIHPFGSILPAVIAGELEQVPRSVMLHGPGSVLFGPHYGAMYDPLLRRLVFQGVEELVAVSPEVASLVSSVCTVSPKHLTTVPNGVDSTRFAPVPNAGCRAERSVLVLSRLDADRLHGIERLMRAIEPWPAWQLTLAGEGNCQQVLLALADTLGMQERVSFAGHVYDPSELLRRHSFVAANGRALLEGAASGCRCILLSNSAPFHIVASADMPALACANYSGRGSVSSARDDELVPALETTLSSGASALLSWVQQHANQSDLLSAWGFPVRKFAPITGLIDAFNAITQAQGSERVAFVTHPGVWRALYPVLSASDPVSDLQTHYISFLEDRNKMLNQLLWRTRQDLARATQAISSSVPPAES